MRFKTLLSFIFVLLFCGSAYSQAHLMAEFLPSPAEKPFKFNQDEQYLRISVDGVYPPAIMDKDILQKIFNDKMDYVLCKLSIYTSDSPNNKITVIPFSLERQSGSNYNYETINPGASYVLLNLLKFPYGETMKIDIELLAWQGEHNYALAKTIFSSVSGLDLLAPEVMTYIDVGLKLIEKLFPAKKSSDSVHDNLAKEFITSNDYRVFSNYDGNKKELLKVKFETLNAIFGGCNFEPVHSLKYFNDLDAWIKALRRSAEESISKNSQESVRSVLLGFSDYIDTKPLVKKDKTLFAAGALHTWVESSVKNCISEGCISAGLFQELPVGNLAYIRDGAKCWDFSGVDCGAPPCIAMSDFLRKSRNLGGREEAVAYIDSDFSLFLDNQLITDIDINSYKNNFVIKNAPVFETAPAGMELVYKFQKGALDLRYKKDSADDKFVSYRDKRIQIYQNFDKGNYHITRVEMFTSD